MDPQGQAILRLRAENAELRAEVAELKEAEQRHLRLIARLSTDSISPDEATEMRGQIASLIAEVGTLRAALRGKDGERDV